MLLASDLISLFVGGACSLWGSGVCGAPCTDTAFVSSFYGSAAWPAGRVPEPCFHAPPPPDFSSAFEG